MIRSPSVPVRQLFGAETQPYAGRSSAGYRGIRADKDGAHRGGVGSCVARRGNEV